MSNAERLVEYYEEELRAVKFVLILATAPLLFFLSALELISKIECIAKVTASISIFSFFCAFVIWGLAAFNSQSSLVFVRYKLFKKNEHKEIEEFAEESIKMHTKLNAVLFKPAVVCIGLGYFSLCVFIFFVLWV